jgi:hypothetical protein
MTELDLAHRPPPSPLRLNKLPPPPELADSPILPPPLPPKSPPSDDIVPIPDTLSSPDAGMLP